MVSAPVRTTFLALSVLGGASSAFQTATYLDLETFSSSLKGFSNGFSDGVYGYVTGVYGGAVGKVARFHLQDLSVQVLDLLTIDASLKGFSGGFTDGVCGYVVPNQNGPGQYSGKVARFYLHDFQNVAVLDLTVVATGLAGFDGGFTDGVHGYLVPYSPVVAGYVARFSVLDFSSVDVLDLTQTSNTLNGFSGGFVDETYGYLVPNNNAYAVFVRAGIVVRFRKDDFQTVELLDLTAIDPGLKGFRGGFTDCLHGYLVPYNNGTTQAYFGTVARFSMRDFRTVEVLRLQDRDSELKGFVGGFTDGTHGYVVPNVQASGKFGKVARFNLEDFATVEVLDLTTVHPGLKGFMGGFVVGGYGYVVPWHNGAAYFGKVVRFATASANSFECWKSSTTTSSSISTTTTVSKTRTSSTTTTSRTKTRTSTTATTTTKTTTSTRTRTWSSGQFAVAGAGSKGAGADGLVVAPFASNLTGGLMQIDAQAGSPLGSGILTVVLVTAGAVVLIAIALLCWRKMLLRRDAFDPRDRAKE